MPRRAQSIRENHKPRNKAIKEEIKAESRPRSMSMGEMLGNQALLAGMPMVIPVAAGNESMSLIIDSDSESENEKFSQNDQSQSLDDSQYSEIDTSKKALERMKNPKVRLVDSDGHEEEIKSESEASQVVEKTEKKSGKGSGEQADKQPSDLKKAGQDMKPAQNWDFKPMEMAPRQKAYKKNNFWGLISQTFGYTVGKICGFIFNLGLLPVTAPIIGSAFARSSKNKDKLQEKRSHQQVPGWNGIEYDADKNSGGAIMEDFRRIPTVWSHPIAAKAAEPVSNAAESDDPRDRERPLQPTISVLVDQPKEGSEQSFEGREMGHTMLGIEYSRFSRVSNRYERYYVQYGFYPVGAMTNVSGSMVMLHRNAVVPGQMIDDWGHSYTISRKFKSNDYQVAEIFKASETYADKGYGYFTRNCTTFVKDMVQNIAGIQAARQIFEEDAVQFGGMENLGMAGAISFDLNARAGMENTLMDLGEKTDTGYQNFGGKRLTQQEYQNYKDSINKSTTVNKITDIPAVAGENMRRMTNNTAFSGELGSKSYASTLKKADGSFLINPDTLADAIENEGSELKALLRDEVLQEQIKRPGSIPPELLQLISSFGFLGMPLLELKTKFTAFNQQPGNQNKSIYDAFTPEDLQSVREDLSKSVRSLNVMLSKYFKNDKRVHMPVMHLISLLNYGIEYVDDMYAQVKKGSNNGELGNIREDMSKKLYPITAGGKRALFTASHYESYLQIFKKPSEAVKNYARYCELKRKSANGEKLTSSEQKEYQKLSRLEKTSLQFDNAHNYMLEKDDFSPKDIEYMFSLGHREKEGDVHGEMISGGDSAAGTYKSLFLEKFFDGMKERFMREKDFDGLDQITQENMDKAQKWLDSDLEKCLNKKFVDLVTAVGGIKRGQKQPSKKNIFDDFSDAVLNDWLGKVFSESNSNDQKMMFANMVLPIAYSQIIQNAGSKFRKVLEKAINLVID